ncbi:HEPN domain-containing protein [Candidatus Babeliales bacterium]|nr:HEPN domain-containing protein [Candidatus Babeliales bacterium]
MQNHEKWLFKAKSDLKTSKVLLREDLLDTALYHTQQCAEKKS